MQKEFCSYEQSLALKELGFDEPCFGGYVKITETQNTFYMNDVISDIDRETPLHESLITKAPLKQQVFRWCREKHDLQASTIMFSNGKYDTGITRYKGTQSVWGNGPIYDTYEEAEDACIDKLIEIYGNRQII